MKKVWPIDNFFAECLAEDRLGTSETEVKDFSIEEQPCVDETRGCVEDIDDCVSFAVVMA